MKHKSMLIGLGLLAVLIGLAVATRRDRQPSGSADLPAASGPLLNFDINQVAQLQITSGGKTVQVTRQEGAWIVPGLFNYPANYDTLHERMRTLALVTAGPVMRGGTDMLEEFGLASTDPEADRPIQVSFLDGDGKPLGALLIGDDRQASGSPGGMPRPGGTFVRVADGPVILVEDALGTLPRTSRDWVDTVLLRVSSINVTRMQVSPAEGTGYSLMKGSSDSYAMTGLKEDEEVQKTEADKLSRALSYLSFVNLADPAIAEEDLGFDKPDTFTLVTKDHLVYTVQLGAEVEDNDRYARLTVAYNKPAPPAEPEAPAVEAATSPDTVVETTPEIDADRTAYETALKEYEDRVAKFEKQAADEGSRFEGWTYILQKSDADAMTLARDTVARKKTDPITAPSGAMPPGQPAAMMPPSGFVPPSLARPPEAVATPPVTVTTPPVEIEVPVKVEPLAPPTPPIPDISPVHVQPEPLEAGTE